MTIHMLGYARTGKELEVMDALTAAGIPYWRGITVDFVRKGKNRTAEPVERPSLPNYIWLQPSDPEQIAAMREVKFLARTVKFLCDGSARAFAAFAREADARRAEADRIVGNRAAICEYKHGDRIEIRDGALAGQFATFRRMVETAADLHPRVEADMLMMGGVVPVRLDPLSVRRAAE